MTAIKRENIFFDYFGFADVRIYFLDPYVPANRNALLTGRPRNDLPLRLRLPKTTDNIIFFSMTSIRRQGTLTVAVFVEECPKFKRVSAV